MGAALTLTYLCSNSKEWIPSPTYSTTAKKGRGPSSPTPIAPNNFTPSTDGDGIFITFNNIPIDRVHYHLRGARNQKGRSLQRQSQRPRPRERSLGRHNPASE
eukprot:scaffold8405_cov117-Isochrysis_galbana.AAC.6